MYGSGAEEEVPLYVSVAKVVLDGVGTYTVNAQGAKFQKIEKSKLVQVL